MKTEEIREEIHQLLEAKRISEIAVNDAGRLYVFWLCKDKMRGKMPAHQLQDVLEVLRNKPPQQINDAAWEAIRNRSEDRKVRAG